MAKKMSNRERVMAAIKGQEVDRPPVSVWRHFFDKEQTTDGLVDAMLAFQQRHGWDFMKVNPRAHYHMEDWGTRYKYSSDPYVSPTLVSAPVQMPQDWPRVKPLNIRSGVLGEQINALQRIGKRLKGQIPFMMTVFTPLSIAARLVPSEQEMVSHLREHPDEVHTALEVITDTFARFAKACIEAGADGIFFATTSWATRDMITEAEYKKFGRPYDLKVLKAVQGANLNILHVCKSNNMLALLADYPVQAFNWDARDPTNPTLAQGLELVSRAVVGGLSQKQLDKMTKEQVLQQVDDALVQTRRRRFMLASGCTISPQTSGETLDVITARVRGKG